MLLVIIVVVASVTEAYMVGVLDGHRQYIWPHSIEYVVEVRSVNSPGLCQVRWHVRHQLCITLELLVKVLYREFVVFWHSYKANLGRLEELLAVGKYVFQIVFVDLTLRNEVVLC